MTRTMTYIGGVLQPDVLDISAIPSIEEIDAELKPLLADTAKARATIATETEFLTSAESQYRDLLLTDSPVEEVRALLGRIQISKDKIAEWGRRIEEIQPNINELNRQRALRIDADEAETRITEAEAYAKQRGDEVKANASRILPMLQHASEVHSQLLQMARTVEASCRHQEPAISAEFRIGTTMPVVCAFCIQTAAKYRDAAADIYKAVEPAGTIVGTMRRRF